MSAVLYSSAKCWELAEPARINKYQRTANLLNRITLCPLPPPPHYAQYPHHYHHLEMQLGTRVPMALANAPSWPIPPQSSGQDRPAPTVQQLSSLQEGTDVAKATRRLLEPSNQPPLDLLKHNPPYQHLGLPIIPDPVSTSCVTFSKLLNLSAPKFLHLKNGNGMPPITEPSKAFGT